MAEQVVVIIGPGAAPEVVDHVRRVLVHFGVPFAEVAWADVAPSSLESSNLKVVLFATGFAYTNEHLPLPDDATVPVLRMITDPVPPPEHLLQNAPLMATMEFGVQGAIDAANQAVRILGRTDPDLLHRLKTMPYTEGGGDKR